MSIGNFPDNLSQAILVGIILVGRLGVKPKARTELALELAAHLLLVPLRLLRHRGVILADLLYICRLYVYL